MTALSAAIDYLIAHPREDYDLLEILVREGVDINQKMMLSGYDEISPLAFSMMAELELLEDEEDMSAMTYDVATWLIHHGADVNTRTDGIPLFFAPVMTGSADVLALMIREGVHVNARDEQGYSALYYPITQYMFEYSDEYYDAFSLLVASGYNLNTWDSEGKTILTHAAELGNPQLIKFLLESGVDPTLLSLIGETAFNSAPYNEKLADSDEYWQLCDAHYLAMDALILKMQPYIMLSNMY